MPCLKQRHSGLILWAGRPKQTTTYIGIDCAALRFALLCISYLSQSVLRWRGSLLVLLFCPCKSPIQDSPPRKIINSLKWRLIIVMGGSCQGGGDLPEDNRSCTYNTIHSCQRPSCSIIILPRYPEKGPQKKKRDRVSFGVGGRTKRLFLSFYVAQYLFFFFPKFQLVESS